MFDMEQGYFTQNKAIKCISYRLSTPRLKFLSVVFGQCICRLFFKIDLLTDFATLCLTDFIDWRYIHSWLVFQTQRVNCCPHERRNYTCVLLPLYLLSDLPPSPLPKQIVQYIQTVCGCWGGGGGVLNCAVACRPYSAGVLQSVSDQTQNLQNCFTTPNKVVKTTLWDWCL